MLETVKSNCLPQETTLNDCFCTSFYVDVHFERDCQLCLCLFGVHAYHKNCMRTVFTDFAMQSSKSRSRA